MAKGRGRGRQHWRKQQTQDPYFRRAKEEGYRARSAYKLLQIQERFHVLHRGDTVLDLGAAPGSWSQVATRLVGSDGLVIAVDLQPIEPIEDVLTIQGDMTSAEVQEELATAAGGPVDIVLSDAAPNVSGIRLRDHAFSIALVYSALDIAQRLLRPGGSFVAKVFEGEDFAQLLVDLRNRFQRVKPFYPDATRREGYEIFVVCQGFE
ncbi:MAG: RlmE family RNA methyltransferase [Anaerolineae bacterium]|jgi:23S rRNA (uridine2552-2'-O)-methyltransferase